MSENNWIDNLPDGDFKNIMQNPMPKRTISEIIDRLEVLKNYKNWDNSKEIRLEALKEARDYYQKINQKLKELFNELLEKYKKVKKLSILDHDSFFGGKDLLMTELEQEINNFKEQVRDL